MLARWWSERPRCVGVIANLRSRLTSRVQITTDGLNTYLEAIEGVFRAEVDYAMLNKIYGHETRERQRRYHPRGCIGTEKRAIAENPDKPRVSTSYVERQNRTMRMSMRRFTYLTDGFSKKWKTICTPYFFISCGTTSHARTRASETSTSGLRQWLPA